MFNAVFCLGCDASEMDVLSCDVWMLVLFACWIGLPMKKFVPEPTRHGTPIRSCKISGLATWIFEIDVLGYLRIIKQGQSNCTQCHNQVFSFFVTVCPHKQPDPTSGCCMTLKHLQKYGAEMRGGGSLKNAPT